MVKCHSHKTQNQNTPNATLSHKYTINKKKVIFLLCNYSATPLSLAK